MEYEKMEAGLHNEGCMLSISVRRRALRPLLRFQESFTGRYLLTVQCCVPEVASIKNKNLTFTNSTTVRTLDLEM